MVQRMPVARRTDGYLCLSCRSNPAVQHRHHLITAFDWQRAAGTEVDLDIDDGQRVAGPQDLSRIGHVV
jgi:hypothetical protein